MNIQITTLTIASLILASCIAVGPASAEGGARFNYAPNLWAGEGHRHLRRAIDPVYTVRNGMVPGASALGIDPVMFQKPQPAPIVATQVPAVPSFAPMATPQAPPPKNIPELPKTSFAPAFGKPQSPLTLSPKQPVAQVAHARSFKPVSNMQAAREVTGTLRSHKAAPAGNGMLATANKGIDSYGKNFGYVPGPFLPSASNSGGISAQADVHGTIITHR